MKPKQFPRAAADLWNRFSAAERHQIVGAVCFLMALCYGLLLWQPGQKKLENMIYAEQKQAKRLKSSSGGVDLLKNFNLTDVETIRKEASQARAALAALETERARLVGRFVPLEDLETLQALKSDLTRLAEGGDMEIAALEHIYRDPRDRDRPPTQELLKSASEANPYKRPLLRLKAKASYRGLMSFLDGLAALPRVAAPVWSDISVRAEQGEAQGGAFASPTVARQWLEVEIHFAI
ncbi:MAG: hypothetical protein LBT71_09230 [Azoarcus sp.]|jgi:hypothetical protein|nr:hypothetical protein [Azoarcus sp.]